MSLQNLKDALVDTQKTEINGIEKSRVQQLRSLYYLTKLVGDSPVAALFQHAFLEAPPSPTEVYYLESNNISSGKHFHDESLPLPTLKSVSTNLDSKVQPHAPAEQKVTDVQAPLSPDVEVTVKSIPVDAAQLTPASASTTTLPVIKSTIPPPHTPPRSPHVAVFVDGVLNESIAPHAPTTEVTAVQSPDPGQTDILASQSSDEHEDQKVVVEDEIAEADDLGTATDSQKETNNVEDLEHGKGPTENTPVPANDNASSPSSTAGAYSTSTPKPAAHSPDTSPEAEVPPASSTPFINGSQDPVEATSPVEPIKDRLEDVVPSTSPDAQLRLEEAQAQRPVTDGPNQVPDSQHAFPELEVGEASSTHTALKGQTSAKADTSKALTKKVVRGEPDQAKKLVEGKDKLVKSLGNGDIEMQDVPMAQPAITDIQTSQKNNHAQSPEATPSRMRTRMVSGAIRQKSISEILGETPRKSPQTPSTPHPRPINKLGSAVVLQDESSRPKTSTVVFSKDVDPTTSKALRNELEGYLALKGASIDPEKDYLRPLFLHQAWGPPRAQYIQELVQRAQKTIATGDHIASYREQQDYKILRRIYNLQNANKWSLRQMAKYQDPTPATCHWDHVLDEMKWMRTDFREERRWKIQLARNLAEMCAEYHAASDGVKQQLRVPVKRPQVQADKVVADSFDDTPELVPSSSTGSSVTDDDDSVIATVSPSAIFSLDYNQVIFHLDQTPSGDALLAELPLYDPKADGPQLETSLPPRANHNLVPVSKFVTGKLVPKISGLPRKRSRYEYEQSDDEPHLPRQSHKRNKSSDPSPFLSPARRSSPRAEIPPEEQEVALFNPINKHILDRLHTTHAFRPPNEFPMPSIAYFEARPQSQWTWDEDQRLRYWVRKYIYNWSLIAMELQSQCQSSDFVSGAERRTPWECFERWVQLEGLPAEMSKTAYFKAYQARLEAATNALQLRAQHAAAQVTGGATPTAAQANVQRQRRTSHQPVRVERRREARHISMIDAMKKIAKKRESAALRQADNTKAAEMRKSSQPDTNQARPTIHTPQELSRFKQEKELQAREKEMAARAKIMEQRNRAMQLAGQPQAAIASMQQQPSHNVPVAQSQGIRAPTAQANQTTSQAQLAQTAVQPRVANALSSGGMSALNLAGLSQQQQLQVLQAGRYPPQQNMPEMARLAALQQQRQFQMQLPSQNPGLATAHLSPSANMQQNQQQQLLANFQRNNMGLNGVNGMNGVNGVSMSPTISNANTVHSGMQHPNPHAAALARIMQDLQQQYPHLPPEQIRGVAMDKLKGQIHTMRNNALQAAAGTTGSAMQTHSLAQQHLGLHGHNNAQMIAFAAAQNALGNAGSPNTSAATLTPNGMNGAHGMGVTNGLSGNIMAAGASINSPTQMYRNMHAAQQARLSGSPGLMPARPDSRAGTPNGMVRSASGASGSPTLGSGLAR